MHDPARFSGRKIVATIYCAPRNISQLPPIRPNHWSSMRLRLFAIPLALAFTLPTLLAQETIVIDAQAPATPFPHFWEGTFGSGRAILSLRESYRNDLRAVKQVADFNYVRFHAIFHDEVGVYNEDAQGNPVYNFSYVDQIYDGLLANGVRPFVEISFMPRKLAAQSRRAASVLV